MHPACARNIRVLCAGFFGSWYERMASRGIARQSEDWQQVKAQEPRLR